MLQSLQNVIILPNFHENCWFCNWLLLKCCVWSGAEVCTSCRFWKMLSNAYFLAKIGADTAENEQHFAEILPKNGNYPTGPLPYGLTLEAEGVPLPAAPFPRGARSNRAARPSSASRTQRTPGASRYIFLFLFLSRSLDFSPSLLRRRMEKWNESPPTI